MTSEVQALAAPEVRAGDDLYAPEVDQQRDELVGGPDVDRYDAVLDAIDHVLDRTKSSRQASSPLRDASGRQIPASVVR